MLPEALIDLALAEDLSLGDLTSEAIFPPGHRSSAHILAKEDLVLSGLDVAEAVLRRLDPAAEVRLLAREGDAVRAGTQVLRVQGSTLGILQAERTALNFLQRLSGIATHSRRHAAAAAPYRVRVVDTRKTTPGWRFLEKRAVRAGGCHNHRFSLGEHVLIKDNHIAAAGSLRTAIERCRARAPHTAKIECEVTSLAQLREALDAGAEVVLLDNMSPELVRQAVAVAAGRALLEVSGGVNLQTLPAYAAAGVDVISIGALTHSAPSVDLSLEIEPATPRAVPRRPNSRRPAARARRRR